MKVQDWGASMVRFQRGLFLIAEGVSLLCALVSFLSACVFVAGVGGSLPLSSSSCKATRPVGLGP